MKMRVTEDVGNPYGIGEDKTFKKGEIVEAREHPVPSDFMWVDGYKVPKKFLEVPVWTQEQVDRIKKNGAEMFRKLGWDREQDDGK